MVAERSRWSELPDPPETERDEVVEQVHGHEVVDPYRWLEGDGEDVEAWVEAQNEYADRLLSTPTRDALRPRIEALAEVEGHFPVEVAGETYFQRIEPADADHPVLYVRRDRAADPEVLVDPNEWDGERSMDWYAPSPDGDLVAYGVAEGGNEQYDVVVIDLEGEELDRLDGLGRTGPGTLAWYDGGFYYVRTGEVGAGGQLEKELCRHELGEEKGEDEVIEGEIAPDVWPVLDATDEGGLVAVFSEMSIRGDVYAFAPGDDELTPAITGEDASFLPTVHEGTVYLRTDHDAPRSRALAAPFEDLLAGNLEVGDLRVVVPESEAVLRGIDLAGDSLVAHHHRDAVSELSVYDPDSGERLRGIDVPGMATVLGVSANPDAPELFYRVESFSRPPEVRRADPRSGESEPWSGDDVPLAEQLDLTVRQAWFESDDGTELPAFVVHRSDLEPAEDPDPAPTVLYGYGGFRNNMTPGFRKYALPFLADGGVYVQAVLRGGEEYGEPWHEAGMCERKTNVFEDFEAVADGLVERGYTDSDHLAATGGSNGGLLVGAAITRRPDLFGAAVSAVPLLDMIRFHRFLLGEAWTNEYGSPEDPDAFEYLYDYSPYHNVERRDYPAVLLRTAAGDTRVHPAHARKMAALLQAQSTSGEPVILRTTRETGHGVGTPTAVEVRERLDQWTFLYDALGLDPETGD